MNQAKIEYTITPTNPAAHLFTIRCHITQPDPAGQQLWMPAWIPGSYMIRDFARNILNLHAQSENQTILVEKLDKQTWLCAPSSGPLSIEYQVYAFDMSVRSAYLDPVHGFFNGSSVFLAVQGQEEQSIDVIVHLPRDDFAKNWRIATTLDRVDTALFAPGVYRASNYDELIDHPVQMGELDEISFEVHGVPHHIVVNGRHQADLKRLADDVGKICQTQAAVFGEIPKMERYMFLLQVIGDGYGGLEHRNSCSLVCSRIDLPTRNMKIPTDGYITLLGLFSHEYFHTWNVKRIKPVEFMPYDLRRENHTRQLWAFEGITSYYDDLALVRSGLIDEAKYLELLGKTITRVLRGSGRLKQSLRESSFDAWTKFYKQDENAPNAIVSYYTKGAMFALALDFKIRADTENSFSLNDVMYRLWHEYGRQGAGIEDYTIQKLAEAVCGRDPNDFFTRFLTTTEDLPLHELGAYMGIELKSRIAESLDDAGGTASNNNNVMIGFNLGAKFIADTVGVKIQFIFDNGDLQIAGLAAGDIIIAINGIKANKDNLQNLMKPYQIGDKVIMHAFRRDELMQFQVSLSQAMEDIYYFSVREDPQGRQNRRNWLHPEPVAMAGSSNLKKSNG